ncbi:MAG: Na+/H+ antiporter NhaC family protein [Oscillospiraceae bacterium]
MKNDKKSLQKDKKGMSLFGIILIVIVIIYGLSFIIPSGAYQREGNIAVAGSYAVTEKIILSPFDVIRGIGEAAYNSFGKLFIAIMIIGGFMGVVNSTGAIDHCLNNLITKSTKSIYFIIPIFIFTMGFLGALGSMISSVVLFIPLGMALAKQLKADRGFAVGLIICGSYTGFMSSPINPLTTLIGQQIAGLEPYSGAPLRLAVTIVNLIIVSAYLIWYMRRCQKDPVRSADLAKEEIESGSCESEWLGKKMTHREILVLLIFFGSFAFIAIGAPIFRFDILDVGSIMFPMALLAGFAAKYDLNTTMKHFVKGVQGMSATIVFMIIIGGVTVILNNSGILDSIVYYISIPLGALSHYAAAVGMFIVNAIVNIFINSGSGQTAVMMPIMAPLSDVVGVSRQMAVLTLQFGDGFTNLLAPTSVNLMACLALSKTSLKQWYKFAVPLHAILFVVMSLFILLGTVTGY